MDKYKIIKFIDSIHIMTDKWTYELDWSLPKLIEKSIEYGRNYKNVYYEVIEFGDTQYAMFSEEKFETVEAERWHRNLFALDNLFYKLGGEEKESYHVLIEDFEKEKKNILKIMFGHYEIKINTTRALIENIQSKEIFEYKVEDVIRIFARDDEE
jgi:hypothetical protein